MRASRRLSRFLLLALAIAVPAGAQTQGDGARVYWKTLAGANAVTFWPIFATGNTNPFDPAHTITPDTSVDAMIALLGAHKVLPISGRSATLSGFLPVGNLQAQVTGVPAAPTESTLGFGDPMVQLTINLAGGPAIRTLAEMARYEPTFTLDLLGAVALPIGEHDDSQALNLGQGRWYGRIGAPLVYRIGPWVPGRRTTLEAVPAVWFFEDDDNYRGGRTLSNGPLFQLEAHATRDLTESLWASFDASWFAGSKAELDGVAGETLNNAGAGFTLGFQVTSNLAINTSYFSTVGDSDPTDLRGDEFRIMFTYGWHELLEGVKRLGKD
jgi:hypothetical protein